MNEITTGREGLDGDRRERGQHVERGEVAISIVRTTDANGVVSGTLTFESKGTLGAKLAGVLGDVFAEERESGPGAQSVVPIREAPSPPTVVDEILDVEAAAKLLDCSVRHLQHLCRLRKVRFVAGVGTGYRFSRRQLVEDVAAMATPKVDAR
ncbi:MAG: helix-turn-helix domain-containing protein [Planctomycetes bacterium]|nr:helix-turn-helix domain-containing protein [Planctomycetota bacterium]